MLDHITLVVADYERSKLFYQQALAPLGGKLLMEFGQIAGFGLAQKPTFWISGAKPSYYRPEHRVAAAPLHVAFAASDRAAVDAFYKAAIAAGGKDFGAPGLRPIYHPGYYGGFVLDLDGNDIEAVFHGG